MREQQEDHWNLDISNDRKTVSSEYVGRSETLDNNYVTVIRQESRPSDSFIKKNNDDIEYNLVHSKQLDVSHHNQGVSGNQVAELLNQQGNQNSREDIAYKVANAIMNKITIRCCGKQIYVYDNSNGYFEEVSESQFTVYVRKNISAEMDKKLNKNRMIDLIYRIESSPNLQIEYKDFNRYTHLINFKNGVYNLEEDLFMKHNPDYLFTNFIDAKYDPRFANKFSRYTNHFTEFLDECTQGDRYKIMSLQELTGYILSNYSNAKKFFILLGQAHSGKSLWLSIWRSLIGERFTTAVTLKQLGTNRFMAAELFKSRLNISPEMNEEGSLKGVDVIKALTGGDLITGEKKGKDPFYFYSKTKLVAAGNHMPGLSKVDTTGALTDRMMFILFNQSVPEERRDKALLEKLMNEKNYIIMWAIEGLRRLEQQNFVFTESSDAIEFKNQFIAESGITGFIEDCCIIDVGDRELKTHRKPLYETYISYCKNNQSKAMSSKDFFNEVIKTGVEPAKFRIDGTTPLAGYRGIKLKHS